MDFALGCSHLPKYSYLLANWQFAAQFSNCSKSLNFSAKINCNTSRQNVPKWGKICTGLKFDLVHFNAPQTKFKNIDNFEGPCILHVAHCNVVAHIIVHPETLARFPGEGVTITACKCPVSHFSSVQRHGWFTS